ncbi:MAG: response regulator [Bacteroidota bacterium]
MKGISKKNILLIEDNQGDIRLIKEMLNEIYSFKYQLVTAITLKQGLEEIKMYQKDIVLILLDLNLPDSKGKHTFDAIKEKAKKIPIVLVSELRNIDLSIALLKEGAQDYISKQDMNSTLLEKTISYAIERENLFFKLSQETNLLQISNSNYIGRELKMIDLKKEVNDLLIKSGQKERYVIVPQNSD